MLPRDEDELTRLRAELAGPLGLTAGELERLAPFSAPGTCMSCHTPLSPPRNGKCWACAELAALKAGAGFTPARSRPPPRARGCDASRCRCRTRHQVTSRALARGLLLVTGLVLLHAAHLWAPLTLIAFVFIVMSVSRRSS